MCVNSVNGKQFIKINILFILCATDRAGNYYGVLQQFESQELLLLCRYEGTVSNVDNRVLVVHVSSENTAYVYRRVSMLLL
jgi:hypothetical protein